MDANQLLSGAMEEIRSLRRVCERQSTQLEMLAVFKAALLGPPPPQQWSVDITVEIAKYLAEQSPLNTATGSTGPAGSTP